MEPSLKRGWIAPYALFPLLVLLANVLIVRKLFSVEYSAYFESNECPFIAIARQVASHPWDLQWFSQWECGLPFQNTYLPLLQYVVGWFSRVTGRSAALSFHQVSAAFYCIGPVLLYYISLTMTGKRGTSFLVSSAFSVLSPCGWLAPTIRTDLASLWTLRRLHVVGYYGEAPLPASMAVLPLGIIFLYVAATRNRLRFWIPAGLAMAATILFNAFGAVVLGMVGLSLLGSTPSKRAWRLLGSLLLAGALTYALIS